MKNWLAITVTLLVSGSVLQAHAAGDAAAGKEKAAQCASCHGADGNSVNPEFPKLAGQHEQYLVKQLDYFAKGQRQSDIMKPMALMLDEQGREDVAAYFSSQKRTIGEADPKLVELGQQIYRAGNPVSKVAACMGCHGPDGAGNPAARYPSLDGQNAKYVENQLHGFAEGRRVNENARKMMQILASRLTNKEIRAVASYIQGLH
jgi:cytochrome c553